MKHFFRKWMVIALMLLVPLAVYGGSATIKGTVTDATTGEPLPGANVAIVGTMIGTTTDAAGHYTLNRLNPGVVTVKVTFIGYEPFEQDVTISSDNAVITLDVKLEMTVLAGTEVMITANRAIERETPVSFSNVGEKKLRQQFTVQDVPHLIKHTPGIYVTTDGGNGLGDSKVLIRGFDEQRIQVMINNIPVNDPESKKVYWSNWGSLPAASQSIQVQRGVGSSLYGSGAFGGSINVVTSEAPAVSSFKINTTGGMYNTYKAGIEYNTGLINNKWSFLGRFNYLRGNGFRRDTFYNGLQYYFALTNFLDEKNTLRLILHGAPQYHSYSYYSMPAKDWAKYGRDWNPHPFVREDDPGLTGKMTDGTSLFDVLLGRVNKDKGGEVIGNGFVSFDNNVYHKPQLELHHTMTISKTTYLQNTAFFSIGRGFGENVNSYYKIGRSGQNGEMTIQDIVNSKQYQYRNHSIHNQLGILSTLMTQWKTHKFSFGIEGRYWWARHYGLIVNTFGQETITYFIGGVPAKFREGDVYYDYTGIKPQISTFGHALWRFGDLSIMTDLQFSLRHYRIREDFPSNNNRPDPNGDFVLAQFIKSGNNDGFVNYADATFKLLDFTKDYSFLAPKFGVNYNLSRRLNVFGNYSRAYNEPRVKYFYNYGQPTDALPIETSDDFEVGFGYRSNLINLKVNGYRINFANKAYRIQDPTKANQPGYDYKGRRYVNVGDAIYQGVEVAADIHPMTGLDLGLSVSKMNNAWGSNITTEAKEQLGIEKGKIEPGMPQFMINTMIDYTTGPFFLSANIGYYQDYYILPDNEEVAVEWDLAADKASKMSKTLPAYTRVDMILGYRLPLAGYNANLSLHINNLFDTEYWQLGNEYGLIPGPERNIQLNLSFGL